MRLRPILALGLIVVVAALLGVTLGAKPGSAQATSYIIVHAHNPEGIEIASIGPYSIYSVRIYEDDRFIGYGAHNEDTHDMPIAISAGLHTIEVDFNGMALTEDIDIAEGETQELAFTFDRTVLSPSFMYQTFDFHDEITQDYYFRYGSGETILTYYTSLGGGYRTQPLGRVRFDWSWETRPDCCGEDFFAVTLLADSSISISPSGASSRVSGTFSSSAGNPIGMHYELSSPWMFSNDVTLSPQPHNSWYVQLRLDGPHGIEPHSSSAQVRRIMVGSHVVVPYPEWLTADNQYSYQTVIPTYEETYVDYRLLYGGDSSGYISGQSASASFSFEGIGGNVKIASVPFDIFGTGVGGDGNQPPVAFFTYSPEDPLVVGEELSFDAASSHDPDGEIVSYAWDFGDGDTAAGEEIQHTYTEADEYTVTLTVSDEDGLTDSTARTVVIRELTVEAWTSGRFVSNSQDWYESAAVPLHVEVLAGDEPIEGATVLIQGVPRGLTGPDGRLDIFWPLPGPPTEGPFTETVGAQWRAVSVESKPVLLYDAERRTPRTATLTEAELNAYDRSLIDRYLERPGVPTPSLILDLITFLAHIVMQQGQYFPYVGDVVTVDIYGFSASDVETVYFVQETVERGGQVTLASSGWTESMIGALERSGISVNMASPATLYVTAPDGSHAGYDPLTGELVLDFPVAISDPGDDHFRMFIPAPVQGRYLLNVVGTESGSYTLSVQGLDSDGAGGQVAAFSASITDGGSHAYDITVPETGDITVRSATPTPTPPPPVGGISMGPNLGALPLETSQPSNAHWVVVGIAGAVSLLALGGAAWYVRRQVGRNSHAS